jgi:aminobenzoyl-glutamate utilization protein B
MTAWVRQIADGAAMATQTRAEVDLFYGMWDLLPNDTMIALLHQHMTARVLEWSEAEQDFARTCQSAMGLPETGLATQVLPILGDITAGASTDIGDISYVTPVGVFGWPSLPLGVSLHTWPVTAFAGMSIGDKASIDAAAIMAGAGYDFMTNPALRTAASADLNRRRGDLVYTSPLPADRVKPDDLPDFLHKGAGDDMLTPLNG